MGYGNTETRTKKMDVKRNFIHGHTCVQYNFSPLFLFFLFLHPLLLGDSYILYRPSPIIWALHLLIIQTPIWAPVPSDTLINSLWVAVDKVALFRGLLLINVAWRVVVIHLIWWWQPFMRYFRFPSSFVFRGWTTVAGAHFWSRFCNVWGGITPRTRFLCPSGPK